MIVSSSVVAAINGQAVAGGCALACAADYRLMAQQTGRIGVRELLVGVPFPTIALENSRNGVRDARLKSQVRVHLFSSVVRLIRLE